MDEHMANDRTILCECGHPLGDHAIGAGQCYKGMRRMEKKKNHLGQDVKVRCGYMCFCSKFVLSKDSEVKG